jgi:hypothetical protein
VLKGKFQAEGKNPAKSPDIFERLTATVDDVDPAILAAWGSWQRMWHVGFDYFPVNAERFRLDMLAEIRPAAAESRPSVSRGLQQRPRRGSGACH